MQRTIGSVPSERAAARPAGFTYIGLLLMVAVAGVAASVVCELWSIAARRDKEQELLFIGHQFRRALVQYVANGTTSPRSLEDLLKDPRMPDVRRYLRKVFRDPITGRAEWGLVKGPGDSIIGVRSLSDEEPIKQANFVLADRAFEGKKKYSEWVFQAAALNGAGAGTDGSVSVGVARPQPGGVRR